MSELAYLLCCYAVSPDASITAVRKPDEFFDPFLANHYDNPAVVNAYGRAFLDVHRSSMENCIPDFYVSGHDFYIDVLRENLQRALRGSMSAKAALDVAALQWRQITQQADKANLQAQWAGLLEKYPAAVRQFGR